VARRALPVLAMLVIFAWSAAVMAQAPVNAQMAVRYHNQPEASASAKIFILVPAKADDLPTEPVDFLLVQRGASAQLHELGSIYSWSKDNAVQLHELGSIYSWSKDNAVQLHELGSIYSWSKDNAVQLHELGSIYSWSKDNAAQLK